MRSLRRLAPYARPYRAVVILLVLTVILPVAMELVVPLALRVIVDDGILASDMTAIWRGSLFMLAAALVGALATLGQGWCRAWLSQGLAFDMRNDLFAHVLTFSFGNLDRLQTGQLMTRLSSDVDRIRSFASHGLSLLLRALLMILGSLVLIFIIDWQLALILVALLPMAGAIIWWVLRTAQPLYLLVQQKLADLNTLVQENLAGVQVVKAFVRERFEIDRFEDHNVDYTRQNIRVGRLMAVALPILTLLTNLGIVAVVWVGGLSVINGRLTVGELVAFNSYVMIGMMPLLLLSNMLTMVSQAEASAQRVLEVKETQPLIRPAPAAFTGQLTGGVVFQDVSFSYHGDDSSGGRPVLNGVHFAVEPGQQVALLGATGSGKSTLVHLISRFYDVDDGHIAVDGTDLGQWEPRTLRSQMGMALQETILFSGTVRENIAYGRPEATLEQVVAAAKAAQAHDFIQSMARGYDSHVEARGANLSGGQKQRIAIARALLVNPAILILDDSTSAVDLETEFHIQRALDKVMSGRTTFIVAQRINSVLNADQILILNRGQIVAQGTHQQLLATSPIYQEIYQSQLGNGQ
jgi:ATP-binding cassette subfamily B protein